MRLVLFLCFFAFFTFTACKKGKSDITLKGTVTDISFNQGHSGATISLYEIEAGGGQTNHVETKTTGSDGSYSFTFPRNKVENYILRVSKANYFTVEEIVAFSALSIKEDNIHNFNAAAKSWAKIRLVNSNPLPTDHLTIVKQTGKSGCDECCGEESQDFYGALDTTFYCGNNGNTEYSFYYWVEGTANQGPKSAITTAFDTTQILLQY